MPLKIIKQDITTIKCDAIVNAAKTTLLGGGGVDGAIHRAAGRELLEECRTLGGCKTGEAKITKGYKLPAKYVIHTVGPVWNGGTDNEAEKLASCYRESLKLAKQNGCESVAFPLISAGVYGYPKQEALQIAIEEIGNFLLQNDMLVIMSIIDKSNFKISEKLILDVNQYIDDWFDLPLPLPKNLSVSGTEEGFRELDEIGSVQDPTFNSFSICDTNEKSPENLDEKLKNLDESFAQMLFRKIDEIGITDTECYKRANVDRKLFSKIRSNPYYRPSKPTAIAFAIALELDLDETKDFLMKAGFALSHSNKFDIIIEYFIKNGDYNIFEINETLFEFDQNLLGV